MPQQEFRMDVLQLSSDRAQRSLHVEETDMKKINPFSRWLVLIATSLLPIAYFTPIWTIRLWAPQYPEGLEMQIWINKLTGGLDIINGLNHYIGMAQIEESMFPELKYLVYILGGIIFLGIITFVTNRISMLRVFTIVMMVFAVSAMADMYIWGYKYGHNLDPHAAIKIEGESYQPPLIGYKQLLNFTALSIPDKGGWVLFGAGALTVMASIFNWFRNRKAGKSTVNLGAAAILLATLLPSCKSGPEPLRYGHDSCGHCGMKMVDEKYGAEIVTEKGKVYKFDDLNCMLAYIADKLGDQKASQLLVADFSSPGIMVDAAKAHYLKSDMLRSPMGANIAAFSVRDSLDKYSEMIPGEKTKWDAITSGNE